MPPALFRHNVCLVERMVRRSLFDTLRMLRREGIEADARLVGAEVQVSMSFPVPGGAPWTRKFRRTEMHLAAEALTAAVITLYPNSALAKVAELVAGALAATNPRV